MRTKKNFIKVIIMTLMLILLLQVSVNAVIVSTDKEVETENNVTISITSKQALGAYTIKLTDAAGLTLISASGGDQVVSPDNITISGSSNSGITNLGSYTFSTPKVSVDTVYKVKFSITGMETPNLEKLSKETNTAVVTVKAKSTMNDNNNEPTTPSTPDTTAPTEPTFKDANKTVYTTGNINLRASWSTSSPEEKTDENENQNTEVTNTTGNEVTNEISTTTTTTDTKIGLSKLQIKDVDLTNVFKSTTYEYKLNIRELNKLTIEKLEANEEKATIEVVGNENFVEGENIVNIIVKSEDGTRVATYQLIVNKLKTQEESIITKLGTTNIIIIGVIALVVLIGIVIIIIRFIRSRNEEDYEDDEYYYQQELPNRENQFNEEDSNIQNHNENFDEFGNFKGFNNSENSEDNYDNMKNIEEREKEEQNQIDNEVPKIEYTSDIPEEFYDEKPRRKKGKHF